MMDMVHWYFAYGSNLSREQLLARTEPFRTDGAQPRLFRLPNYRLAFNMSDGNGQIYANIVQPGNGVLGVVYRCGREFLEKLDGHESGYERQKVVVFDELGVELEAIVYIALPESVKTEGRPSAEYLQTIVTGARAHGLPEEYIRAIEATALSCKELQLRNAQGEHKNSD